MKDHLTTTARDASTSVQTAGGTTGEDQYPSRDMPTSCPNCTDCICRLAAIGVNQGRMREEGMHSLLVQRASKNFI